MAEYRTTICNRACRHPTIGEAYLCARKRLADQGEFPIAKPTHAHTGGRVLFSIKHSDGSELTPAEIEELERVRANWLHR